MTITLVISVPILPGKQEPWRRFCQALQGSQHAEYTAWREQMPITQEEIWLAQTLQRDLFQFLERCRLDKDRRRIS